MIWARLICVGIVALVAKFCWWVPGFFREQQLANLAIALSLPFAAAALLTLAFSFFRTKRTEKGRLLISRDSAFIRIISVFHDPVAAGSSERRMTVCSVFWSAVALMIVTVVTLGVVGFMLYGICLIIMGQAPSHQSVIMKDISTLLVTFAGALIAIWGLATRESAATKRRKWMAWLFVLLGVGIILLNAAFVVPLLQMADKEQVSLLEALPAYWAAFKLYAPGFALAISLIIFGLGAIVGIVFGLFTGVKVLRISLIGRIIAEGLKAIKSRTCPVYSVITDKDVEGTGDAG